MKHINVKNHAGLVREKDSTAILNVDSNEYEKYISQRQNRLKSREKMDNVERELASLKDDINEIKFLLKALTNG
jgi:uncharacterized HAD superfamily protein|tara:strand:- start:202 stop:423 length:222 start_codon:yes stop_codon:yes gene_type:complete